MISTMDDRKQWINEIDGTIVYFPGKVISGIITDYLTSLPPLFITTVKQPTSWCCAGPEKWLKVISPQEVSILSIFSSWQFFPIQMDMSGNFKIMFNMSREVLIKLAIDSKEPSLCCESCFEADVKEYITGINDEVTAIIVMCRMCKDYDEVSIFYEFRPKGIIKTVYRLAQNMAQRLTIYFGVIGSNNLKIVEFPPKSDVQFWTELENTPTTMTKYYNQNGHFVNL
jgi:hypothetical protein